MRILQIAPLWESVPPAAYGGTESVVHLLCEELVRRGHDVTLWASGDSRTKATLRSVLPFSLRTARGLQDKQAYSWEHAARALEGAGAYDIIHNHAGEEVMALARLVPGTPMLSTMHCNIAPSRLVIWEEYSGYYNTISHSQTRLMPRLEKPRFAGMAYNGIDVRSFPFREEKDDYLLFLARISLEKGAHVAIEAARRAGKRLVLAGKVDPADYEYFCAMIAPQLDGDRVVYVGEADARRKRDLYSRAQAVLLPIMWDEPFGLTMAEAQACGTPVLVFNRGAAPEIVRDGETGFVCERTDEMVEAIGRVHEISPFSCRRWVAEAFDAPKMADRYEELYASIVATQPPVRLTGTAVKGTAATLVAGNTALSSN